MMTLGLVVSALAMLTSLTLPTTQLMGIFFKEIFHGVNPTISRSSAMRCLALALELTNLCLKRGKPKICSMVWVGLSEARVLVDDLHAAAVMGIGLTSQLGHVLPLKEKLPSEGAKRPAKILPLVVLPQPDSPTRQMYSRGFMLVDILQNGDLVRPL
ncbi:MAG: hypothetical protein R2880_11250 [Deinococcales bacterium]